MMDGRGISGDGREQNSLSGANASAVSANSGREKAKSVSSSRSDGKLMGQRGIRTELGNAQGVRNRAVGMPTEGSVASMQSSAGADLSSIQSVLTSETARRMLGYIAPIYGRALRFGQVFNAVALPMQELDEWARGLQAQAMPQTADWALHMWEAEYSLVPAPDDGLQARRDRLLSRVRAHSSANPHAVCMRASAAVGQSVRAVEHVGRNRFALYVRGYTVDEGKLRAAVDEIKPAHLVYDVHCEEHASAIARVGCAARWSRRYELVQVN